MNRFSNYLSMYPSSMCGFIARLLSDMRAKSQLLACVAPSDNLPVIGAQHHPQIGQHSCEEGVERLVLSDVAEDKALDATQAGALNGALIGLEAQRQLVGVAEEGHAGQGGALQQSFQLLVGAIKVEDAAVGKAAVDHDTWQL